MLVAVLGGIRRLLAFHQEGKDHGVVECILAGLSLDPVGGGSSGHRILWALNFVVDVVLELGLVIDETAFVCKRSSKIGFIKEHSRYPSWFETTLS